MTMGASNKVIFCPAQESFPGQDVGPGFLETLKTAVAELAQAVPNHSKAPWASKIPLNGPGEPNSVSPQWLQAARSGLKAGGHNPGPMFDTLSITVSGLETAEGLIARANQLNLQDEFLVGDDPQETPSKELAPPDDSSLHGISISSVAARAHGLLMMNSVRPHPHLGMSGALFTLGCGVLDQKSKLLLHRDIRPTVDTPLCAGCGSCLATCIVDAITIQVGRAVIDHKLCTGCGECMTACHLAGINIEDAGRVPRFQKHIADAGFAVASQRLAAQSRSFLHLNYLTPVPREAAGGAGRDRLQPDVKGVLISADPLAVDQATWDLLVEGRVHGLRQWSGFIQEPGPLLERAEELGLGNRVYDLQVRG